MQAKFTEWKGKGVLEKDLPPGVRYMHCGAEWVALKYDKCFSLPEYVVQIGLRGNDPVTILDWPDHCGPRPEGRMTWADIINGAPSSRARPVYGPKASWWVGAPVGHMACSSTTKPPELLGYLELTD